MDIKVMNLELHRWRCSFLIKIRPLKGIPSTYVYSFLFAESVVIYSILFENFTFDVRNSSEKIIFIKKGIYKSEHFKLIDIRIN